MATLEKIRSKAGLLVLVVGIALFAFIIGDFLNSGSTYFRQSQERIAKINGELIHYQDFQQRIDEMSEMYKMQMVPPAYLKKRWYKSAKWYSTIWWKRLCWARPQPRLG